MRSANSVIAGNRPQGSRMLYYGIVVVFALIMCLMLFMGFWSIYLAIKTASTQIAEQHTNFVAYFFATPTFRDIVISLGSTYGLYFIASVMHLDPWHCFSSMFQYLILLPVYINIFMIYACKCQCADSL